jgi:hypothetical protein
MVVIIWSMWIHCVDTTQNILMLQEMVHMITINFAKICISVRCRVVRDPDVVVRREVNK